MLLDEPTGRLDGAALQIVDAALERLLRGRTALLITDIALPRRSGIELIGCLRQVQPGVKILVLTAHNSEEYIRAALNAGADGYVLKDASRIELLQAVRTILSGQTFLCASVTARVVSGWARSSPSAAASGVEMIVTCEPVSNKNVC